MGDERQEAPSAPSRGSEHGRRPAISSPRQHPLHVRTSGRRTFPVSQSRGIPFAADSLSRVDAVAAPRRSIWTCSSLALAAVVVLRFHEKLARVDPTAAAWAEWRGSMENSFDPTPLRACVARAAYTHIPVSSTVLGRARRERLDAMTYVPPRQLLELVLAELASLGGLVGAGGDGDDDLVGSVEGSRLAGLVRRARAVPELRDVDSREGGSGGSGASRGDGDVGVTGSGSHTSSGAKEVGRGEGEAQHERSEEQSAPRGPRLYRRRVVSTASSPDRRSIVARRV